jgi:hypothetical protein
MTSIECQVFSAIWIPPPNGEVNDEELLYYRFKGKDKRLNSEYDLFLDIESSESKL